jgi:hypothetical protein
MEPTTLPGCLFDKLSGCQFILTLGKSLTPPQPSPVKQGRVLCPSMHLAAQEVEQVDARDQAEELITIHHDGHVSALEHGKQ